MKKEQKNLRYPAVPLISHDPYFNIWSFDDELNVNWARHWTGSFIGISGLIRIDDRTFTWSGPDLFAPAMEQVSCRVLPTRTIYEFKGGGVLLTVTFLTPALLHKLDILSRPLTYVIFQTESIDGKAHNCKVYMDCGGEPCVDQTGEKITWARYQNSNFDLMSFSSTDQRMLERSGDNMRIDWGYFYIGVPKQFNGETIIESNHPIRSSFVQTGTFGSKDDNLDMPQRVTETWMAMAFSLNLDVKSSGKNESWAIFAYDDILAIEYLQRRLPAYWRSQVDGFGELLELAFTEFEQLRSECESYDEMIMSDAEKVGGKEYAKICALSFRQAISAHKLVADIDGTPLFFSKENFSNGCIATVDVTYPSSPLFFLANPILVKGMMIPILEYANTPRWKFPFAPHDLGTYPLANAQTYGGGERTEESQMPVEECGNMLILAGVLVKFNDDTAFVEKFYDTFKLWADYLVDKGYDPENQLCTDDFAGHFAHNTNLSLKAILAIGAFSLIEERLGNTKEAKKYRSIAEGMATLWEKDAYDEGGFYRLAFDRPGSWSQKYNLIWDRLLNINLFSEDIAKTEMKHYLNSQNKYGLPLDNRKTYTKFDWIFWTASLTDNNSDFKALVKPLYTWLNETPSRVPLCDWYETTDGKQVGFQARSVVGGVFIKMLADSKLRQKYADLLNK